VFLLLGINTRLIGGFFYIKTASAVNLVDTSAGSGWLPVVNAPSGGRGGLRPAGFRGQRLGVTDWAPELNFDRQTAGRGKTYFSLSIIISINSKARAKK